MADSDQEMTPAPTLEQAQTSYQAEAEQNAESDRSASMDLVSSSPEAEVEQGQKSDQEVEAEQGQTSDQPEAEQNAETDRSASMDLDSSSPEANSTAREQTPRPDASPRPETSSSESEADPDRDYPEHALPGNTPPQDVPQYIPQNPHQDAPQGALPLDGHPDALPMDPGPLNISDSDSPPVIPIDPKLNPPKWDPDVPIPSIESPDDPSRRSSVQTDGSVFDDSDPGRDTTVATTAPPESPTPRPMPPIGPFAPIAPRPLGMPHDPEPPTPPMRPFAPITPRPHDPEPNTSDMADPQRDVSSSLPSSEPPPTSNGPFSPPPYPPGTNPQIPGLTLSAPVNSHSTTGGGQTNGQQHPRGNDIPTNGESSTNRQQQRPQNGESSNGNQQEGNPFPNSQPGGNARQNQEVVHVTPRHPPVGQEVVRRLSQIAEDQDDSTSDGTTSPGYVLAQNPMEGSSANGLPENNAHQDGNASNAQPGEAPAVQQPPRANVQHNRAVPRGRETRFIEHLDENPQWDGRNTDPPPNSAAPSRQASPAEEKDSEEEL
ncbi:uncharacterized protein FIESC28_04126 [Fusarium coffeatum]|uniref:Uncharacterized protein n=1 Tax=Fusarium coffeatum TaxID=231269 RepID=A0A366S1F0_9HYPO|nr:uncharacterized protein FIESC28_04126 [Fusarium coffeatum]RBR23131.1 hypothetical protein FIESC28_04126 [Fusarium coffeatum]